MTAHSAVQAAKKATCARRSSGLRQLVANASPAARSREGWVRGAGADAIVEG